MDCSLGIRGQAVVILGLALILGGVALAFYAYYSIPAIEIHYLNVTVEPGARCAVTGDTLIVYYNNNVYTAKLPSTLREASWSRAYAALGLTLIYLGAIVLLFYSPRSWGDP